MTGKNVDWGDIVGCKCIAVVELLCLVVGVFALGRTVTLVGWRRFLSRRCLKWRAVILLIILELRDLYIDCLPLVLNEGRASKGPMLRTDDCAAMLVALQASGMAFSAGSVGDPGHVRTHISARVFRRLQAFA